MKDFERRVRPPAFSSLVEPHGFSEELITVALQGCKIDSYVFSSAVLMTENPPSFPLSKYYGVFYRRNDPRITYIIDTGENYQRL